jgi:protein TonB
MLTRALVVASFAGHVLVLSAICLVQVLATAVLPPPRRPPEPFVVRLVHLGDIALPPMPRPAPASPAMVNDAAASSVPSEPAPTEAAPLTAPVGVSPESDLERALGARTLGPGVPQQSLADVAGALPGGAPPLEPEPSAPAGPIRLHSGVTPPVPVATPPPAYPAIARTGRVEGIVVLDVVIDETGRVKDVKVLRSVPALDRAAVDAITSWRYEPARLNGIPIAVSMTVTVRFTLQ